MSIPQSLNNFQSVIILLLYMQRMLSFFCLFLINKNILPLQSELMTCAIHTANKSDKNMAIEEEGRNLFYSSAVIRFFWHRLSHWFRKSDHFQQSQFQSHSLQTNLRKTFNVKIYHKNINILLSLSHCLYSCIASSLLMYYRARILKNQIQFFLSIFKTFAIFH